MRSISCCGSLTSGGCTPAGGTSPRLTTAPFLPVCTATPGPPRNASASGHGAKLLSHHSGALPHGDRPWREDTQPPGAPLGRHLRDARGLEGAPGVHAVNGRQAIADFVFPKCKAALLLLERARGDFGR